LQALSLRWTSQRSFRLDVEHDPRYIWESRY
jgi:hypothetical protein